MDWRAFGLALATTAVVACGNGELSGVDGGPCETHDDCEVGLCLTGAGGMTCVGPCEDEDECTSGSSCGLFPVTKNEVEVVELTCVESNSGAGLLGHDCASDQDCVTGLCHEDTCTELCTECGPDARCDPVTVERDGHQVEVGVCSWDLAAPDLVLGPITVPESGSPVLTFEIPAGLSSFTVVLEHDYPDYSQRVGFISLVAPDDTLLLDFEDTLDDLNQSSVPYPGASSILVPSTDEAAAFPQAGTYRMRVGLFEIVDNDFAAVAGEVPRISFYFERIGEEGGVLDLNLFVAPGCGITAADAAESDFVTNMLATAMAFYQPYGAIRLGNVTFGDIPSDYDSVSDGQVIREICETYSAPGPSGLAVNVFLIDDLVGDWSGFTGNTPSPPGLVGSPASGIVLERMGNAAQTGMVLGHEMGHALALKHTTQVRMVDGSYEIIGYDGISDTPSCSSGTSISECADYRNLMFPLFPLGGLALTPGQHGVTSRNVFLYERDVPRACPATASTYDISRFGFGAGDTTALGSEVAGGCGGDAAPERMHVYRLVRDDLAALEITAVVFDFEPVLHVRRDGCGAQGTEVACETGDPGADVVATIDDPQPGHYLIALDGRSGQSGRFTLQVVEVEP